jgi:AmmeMemoRadiSam system protein A
MTTSEGPIIKLSPEQETDLLRLATQSIEHGLNCRRPLAVDPRRYPSPLCDFWAAFVTVRVQQELRGCVGTIEANQPLASNVVKYAYAAAFEDLRFAEITWEDYLHLHLQISILSPTTLLSFGNEQELLDQLRPGVDGLILEAEGQRGTFLPSVWETIKTPRDFWSGLKRKAGLPAHYWSGAMKVQRYTTYCLSSGPGERPPPASHGESGNGGQSSCHTV